MVSRRQLGIGVGIGAGTIAVIGVLVVVFQAGLIGGKDRRLLAQGQGALKRGELPRAQAHLEELIATFPESPWVDDGLLELGRVYESQQQLPEARRAYQALLSRFPESPLVAPTQERLGEVNVALFFSPAVTELDAQHEVLPGDTLGRIASTYGTTVEFLKRANGLRGDLIRPQQKLKVPKSRFGIVVDKSQNRLLVTAADQFFKTYPVSTGTDGSTPAGTFNIVNKIVNPVWYKQGAVVPPDSPENILGSRWMGISKRGYGIHGTVDPGAVGQSVTAGCVRMTNADVEELFAIVPIGTEVTIVD
jgi:lipoprotein-anchoring transpeptidase ErfK/SrfK